MPKLLKASYKLDNAVEWGEFYTLGSGKSLRVPLPADIQAGVRLYVDFGVLKPDLNGLSFAVGALGQTPRIRHLADNLLGPDSVASLINGERPASIELSEVQSEAWSDIAGLVLPYAIKLQAMLGHNLPG